MPYRITAYTRRQARKHRVTVRRSKNPQKKIDVLDADGNVLASVGATGYGDYPTFMNRKPTRNCTKKAILADARKHRRLYKMRHERDRHVRGTPGYWADKLLW